MFYRLHSWYPWYQVAEFSHSTPQLLIQYWVLNYLVLAKNNNSSKIDWFTSELCDPIVWSNKDVSNRSWSWQILIPFESPFSFLPPLEAAPEKWTTFTFAKNPLYFLYVMHWKKYILYAYILLLPFVLASSWFALFPSNTSMIKSGWIIYYPFTQ